MTLFDDGETDSDEMEAETEMPTGGFDPMSDPVALGAAASVALSWLLFYGKGDKEQGLFVGLWAPTLLGAASYMKQMRLAEKLEKGLRFQ
ncbi:hypothetical protein [Halalkalicoccus sp. NIPERK01]|uniref:hypothetical protein n=1 Tax=Halalkalicoccus sp. NIPERK01 TaxID=3053469 RepID=UPI00256ED746|nr:hypothetical protein [Halalkalicoccus sp. NIPERK01]MDL5361735.1 hypothetical protein [Halalkalicoccus sp. NIPERK01]